MARAWEGIWSWCQAAAGLWWEESKQGCTVGVGRNPGGVSVVSTLLFLVFRTSATVSGGRENTDATCLRPLPGAPLKHSPLLEGCTG